MSAEHAHQLLNAIRRLPRGERLRLVERVVHELAEEHEASPPGAIIDLFADQPELVEAVLEDALHARERDPLRLADG